MSLFLSVSKATCHSAAMLTSEGDKVAPANVAEANTSFSGSEPMTDSDAELDVELDVGDADMTRWSEAEFEEKCTYVVKDTAVGLGPEVTTATTTRAEATLPRNLMFKHRTDSKEVRN